jgi:sec-independent protein translocase protein TatA
MPFTRLPELILFFVIALLIFGPKKLPEMGAAIGKSVTSFKKGLKAATDEEEEEQTNAHLEQRNVELKRLELQALDHEIANRKAVLNAQGATTHVVEEARETVHSEAQ